MRLHFQFRLRTLMIVVTLLAAQCAFVTWVIRDRQCLIRERDDAIQKQRQSEEALLKRLTYRGLVALGSSDSPLRNSFP
jgi:hypothetical protein